MPLALKAGLKLSFEASYNVQCSIVFSARSTMSRTGLALQSQ